MSGYEVTDKLGWWTVAFIAVCLGLIGVGIYTAFTL